jgi:TonB family protein
MTAVIRSQAKEQASYRSVLRTKSSPLGLMLVPSVLLHMGLAAALMVGWNTPDTRPMIERDVYMVSAVVLPKANGLPDKASAPPPAPKGEAGTKAEPPPKPNEMVLKKPNEEAIEGKKEEPKQEPPPKAKKQPSRADLLASLDSDDQELRFATDPDGDDEAKPDISLKQQYGRQLTPYERMVRDAIQYNWFPKYAGQPRDETWTAIGFSIDDKGSIRDPHIDHSSGDFVYDQSCLRAVTRTRRVRPPPAGTNRSISVGFSPQDKR